MKSTPPKIALGIDVTDTHVSMVLLKRDRSHLTVLNALRVPVGEGTIASGHIVDSARLARVLKAANRYGRFGRSSAAVSLPPAATLTRIVPLDEDDPQQIAQFVSGEVQQYAALSGRETVFDFRVLTPARQDRLGKVLIVASDRHAVSAAIRMCQDAGSQVTVIEPAIMACARALRVATPTNPSANNGLLALLKDQTLTVSVFLAGTLTFVRTKHHELSDTEAIYAWVAEEINAVLRFCGIETGREPQGWNITVADEDRDAVAESAEQVFQTNVTCKDTRIVTAVHLPEDAVVASRVKEPVSATAFGLALRVLGLEQGSDSVSLMPTETSEVNSARRTVLVASIVVAVFTLMVLLAVGGLELMAKRVNGSIVATKQADLKREGRTLAAAATELIFIEGRIGSLTGEYECLKQVAESRREVDWAQFLIDLKGAVPEQLRVLELSAQDNSEMLIRGLSFSYEGVHTFVRMLNRSVCVDRAWIIQRDRDETVNGFVQYAIRCTLSPKEAP